MWRGRGVEWGSSPSYLLPVWLYRWFSFMLSTRDIGTSNKLECWIITITETCPSLCVGFCIELSLAVVVIPTSTCCDLSLSYMLNFFQQPIIIVFIFFILFYLNSFNTQQYYQFFITFVKYHCASAHYNLLNSYIIIFSNSLSLSWALCLFRTPLFRIFYRVKCLNQMPNGSCKK